MSKKICFFTTLYDFPRERMFDYYEKILPKNAEIYLVCNNNEIKKFNVKRSKKIGYKLSKLFVSKELRKICKENDLDIITNLSGGSLVALTMCLSTLFTKTKVIFYDHGNPKKKSLIGLSFFQLLLDRVLYCAPDLVKKAQKFLFLIKNKVQELPTAIDTNFFKPGDKNKLRKKLGLKNSDKIITFVGRVQYEKGSDYLLEVIKQNKDKKFILIGNLMDKNYNKEELSNVIFIESASRNEVREYNCASDLFLFLSRSEGLGLAFREAMACGIPTIVSEIEAVRTVPGTMKVQFDLEEIQSKIDSFFSLSQKEKAELSKKTRETLVSNYSEESLAIKHIEKFLDI